MKITKKMPITVGLISNTLLSHLSSFMILWSCVVVVIVAGPAVGSLENTRSLLFGGADNDYGLELAVIDNENIIVAGHTSSDYFNTLKNVQKIGELGGRDIFIVLISTREPFIKKGLVIGGGEDDFLDAMQRDGEGNLYLTGSTFSKGFPAQRFFGESNDEEKTDLFLMKINIGLDVPVSSILIRGDGYDYADALAIGDGAVYLGGNTSSVNFPVTAASYSTNFNATPPGKNSFGFDAFVMRFTADLNTLESSTYLGGEADEFIKSIRLRNDKEIVLAGYTCSREFPRTKGSFTSPNPSGGVNAFVTYMNSELQDISNSMLLEALNHLYVKDMIIDPNGSIWLAGYCNGGNFSVTTNVLFPEYGGGGYDSFIVNLSENLTQIISSSYLGGNNNDFAQTIGISKQGHVVISGFTDSFNTFPCTTSNNSSFFNFGHYDAFTVELSRDLSFVHYSILNGGSGYDFVYKMIIANESIYLVGNSTSSNMKDQWLGSETDKYKGHNVLIQMLNPPF